ncbi:FKBP-type peptidyl-prolyl cis-trans isomerase [Actinoplanes sp. HUAS TT8]|uniref:FKBP-type peptidyl-prolyl cis-trans isomerase n=1 Tax=Actinoplanes sp. HUAS TT8 TaxID=3447453 RepID=UPI003F523918
MTDRTREAVRRRGQAILGGAAGVLAFAALVTVFVVVRSGGDDKPAPTTNAAVTASATPSPDLSKEPDVPAGTGGPLTQLVITDLIEGTGPVVRSGQTVTFNYKLIPYKGGAVIDSSWSRGRPFTSQVGAGRLIPGWDQGIPGQKVGSRIQLDVPAELAYKDQDLRFVIDILSAQ